MADPIPPETTIPRQPSEAERARQRRLLREAQALRQNLHRRKAQVRHRQAAGGDPEVKPD